MPYMLLIIEGPDDRKVPPAEGRRRYDAMQAFCADLGKRGLLMAAEALAPPVRGTRVKSRPEATIAIDGPFAEAKEIVGGFVMVDCPSRADAVALARTCPAAAWSLVEVREIAPCFEETS